MMRVFKLFSFWLTIFAFGICFVNMTGYDDKNLLLFLTSPPLLFLDDYSSFLKRFFSELTLIWIFYLLHVWFWCCIGLVTDSIVHRSLRKKLLKYVTRIGVFFCILVLISVIFYTFQNSENTIAHILKNPDQHNEQ